MKVMQLRLGTRCKQITWRSIPLGCVLLLSAALIPQAKADFVGAYDLSNFTLTDSTFADGTAQTPDMGATLIFTGPNDGSDKAGTTDLTIAAAGTGEVSFDYAYSSIDDPGNDDGGYLLDGAYVQLADTDGQSGSASFAVMMGDTFGFRINTLNNTGEPGILTITNFNAPSSTAPTPEPASWSLMLLAGIGVAGLKRITTNRRSAVCEVEETHE